MMNKIETTGKKVVNAAFKGGCFGVECVSGVIESAAAVGELTCWAIRMGAEKLESKAYDVRMSGGPFNLDEEKSKERAEEILTQYL